MSLNGKHQPIKTIHEKKWQQIGKFVQWKVVKNFYKEISKYNNYKEEKALKNMKSLILVVVVSLANVECRGPQQVNTAV